MAEGTSPSLSVYQDDAGTVVGSFALPENHVKAIAGVNWPSLLQAVVAALPEIMAIVAAFSSAKTPAITENKN